MVEFDDVFGDRQTDFRDYIEVPRCVFRLIKLLEYMSDGLF